MKIVVLDGYTENPGDISWEPLEALGEVTVYDRTSYEESPLIAERIGDAEVVVINKTPISKETIDKCPNIKTIAVLATGYNVVDYEYAKSKGDMPVLCEVFDYDIAKKSLIGPVDMVKRYAETICAEYDNFGLMVDLSHIPMLHETIEESLLPVQQYIRHAHMGNTVIKSPECPAYGDEHPRFGFPNSENDVKELADYLRLLMEIGFISEKNRPIVSFEVKPFEEEDPDICLANAKRTLDLAWELV